MKITILILILIGAGVFLINSSHQREETLEWVSDCVAKTAQEQGYPGNPYSREAWDLFAPNCR